MVTAGLHARLVALALAVAAALAAPAAAHARVASCPWQPAAQVFLPWGDPAWYASVPDGGLEAGGDGWTLRGGAAIAAGNEPFYVRSREDRRSLALPLAASAVSAPSCIGAGHPTVRFFVRNTGAPRAALRVSVDFVDGLGTRRSLPIGVVTATPEWAPSPVLPVVINALSLLAVQHAAFRFTPVDGGEWRVDDVYVDPYGKG
jgi:hypothetical protein